jgi:type I restriction enzyme S subunit
MMMNKDVGVAEVSQVYLVEAAEQAVPIGYKQTEVGVIPEDWKSCLASEVVNFFAGYSFSSRSAQTSGVKWLKIANVGLNEVKWDAESYLPKNFSKDFESYLLKTGDVVMALTRPLLDNSLKIAKLNISDAPALLNQRVAKLDTLYDNNSNFMYYIVQRVDFIAAMNLAMAGSDPPNIGTKTLASIHVPVPSFKEQTAIADALSDVDALLSELEKLIAKKQAIKTATMQQLLTGRNRLPQFALREDGSPKGYKQSELGAVPEDWTVAPFGSLLSIRHGKNQRSVESEAGCYPILATGGQIGWATSYLWDKPSVLIGRKGTIDKPRYIDKPFWTVDTLFYSEIKCQADAKFVYYRFCMVDWRQYNEASGVPSVPFG